MYHHVMSSYTLLYNVILNCSLLYYVIMYIRVSKLRGRVFDCWLDRPRGSVICCSLIQQSGGNANSTADWGSRLLHLGLPSPGAPSPRSRWLRGFWAKWPSGDWWKVAEIMPSLPRSAMKLKENRCATCQTCFFSANWDIRTRLHGLYVGGSGTSIETEGHGSATLDRNITITKTRGPACGGRSAHAPGRSAGASEDNMNEVLLNHRHW